MQWIGHTGRMAALVVLAISAGCETQPEAHAPVRGRVFYQNRPLSSGTIVFTPDTTRGTTGSLARAEIQPDGSYVLASGELPGAVAGWHRVTVIAMSAPEQAGFSEPLVMPRSLLPDKYRDPDLSGLTCEVLPDQDNQVDFHLE